MYKALVNTNTHITTPANLFKWILVLSIQPKIKTFLWLLQHNRLLTRHYLHSIGIATVANCSTCTAASETLNYIFLTCPNAQQYWHIIGIQGYINNLSTMDSPKLWLHTLIYWKALHLPHKLTPRTFIPLSLWNICLTRNRNLYDKTYLKTSPNFVLHQAIEFCVHGCIATHTT